MNWSDAEAVFWDVDTQVDFLHPTGTLYLKGVEAILSNLEALTAFALRERIPVVASVCAHEENDAEFEEFGAHCLVGTMGQKKIAETQLEDYRIIPAHRVDFAGDHASVSQLVVEKRDFDVFTNPNAESVLECFSRRAQYFVYGVVSEICVSAAAMGLLARGCRVSIVEDAIYEIDRACADRALASFRSEGGTVVRTRDVVGGTSGAVVPFPLRA
ncbi:MAG TPA: isochorismatase family protein [Candidatus Acidoferrum sp.]|jgi:nicotinamidase/pyrazinamidase